MGCYRAHWISRNSRKVFGQQSIKTTTQEMTMGPTMIMMSTDSLYGMLQDTSNTMWPMERFWVATIKTITLKMTWEHSMLMMSADSLYGMLQDTQSTMWRMERFWVAIHKDSNTRNGNGTYNDNNVDRLAFWDAAGQVEYHVTHGKFLGSNY